MTGSTRWLALALAIAGLALPGCSLLLDFGDECADSSDCASKGGGLVCREGLCVAAPGTDGLTTPDTRADAAADAARDGLPEVGPDTAADAAPDSAPDTRIDAAQPDTPRDTAPEADLPEVPWTPTWEDLLVAPCDRVLGLTPGTGPLAPGTVLFGALIPRTGQLSDLGPYLDQALQLAIEEVNQVGGILGRKFGVLSCDSGTSPTQAVAAAQHLVTVAKVPAVIGEISSGVSIEAFNNVLRPAGVLLISPAANSPIMRTMPDDNLIWRTSPNAQLQAQALVEYLLDIRDDPEGGFAKWAIVNRNDTWGNGVAELIANGVCAELGCDEDTFVQKVYNDATIQQDISDILTQLAPFRPDKVVLISYVLDGIGFMNAAAQAQIKDFVTADGVRDTLAFDRIPDQELMCRLFGVSFASLAGQLYDSFVRRYQARWTQDPVPYTAQTYDAFFALAYATVAACTRAECTWVGEDALTGARLAAGLSRLGEGTRIRAGSTDWNLGIQALQSATDATIDYDGASGPLDFDSTGEVTGDVEAWKFNLEQREVESRGIIYRADGAYTAPEAPDPDATCEALLTPPAK